MSDENRSGNRQRKSTGRRSSILKRQDTCYLSDVTETVEKINTPLKRRVSFASTATVRTFEALPWQSHLSDDSGSTSVNHIENDVFGPNPSLLVNVNPKCPRVIPPPVEVNDDGLAQEDEGQVNIKEQNKTIMFSQFNDSDCAMEITTNVSQLSHSWFDQDNSILENSHSNPTLENSFHSEPRVIFPWNNKGSVNNEVEKTQIFLTSDNDNMEFTHNLTGFPSLSERFLKSEYGNDVIQLHENFPKHLSDDHGMADEITADMEITGVIETCSAPKRRSVLVDLTTNKNLTPIEEMSVSSMYVSDNEPWSQQNKSLNFSQVCAKLEALESNKKSLNVGMTNDTKSYQPTSPSQSCTSDKESLSHADRKEEEDDPEISFNFRSSVGPSPNISQSKPFPSFTHSGRNSLTQKPVSSSSKYYEANQKTIFTEDMEMTENQISTLPSTYTAPKNINDVHFEDKIKQQRERTMFDRSMELTNTDLNYVAVGDLRRREESLRSTNTPMHMEEMEMTECLTLTKKSKIWQRSLDVSHQHQAAKEINSVGDNLKEQSVESAQNTLYMGDMEFTHCINSKGNNTKCVSQRTMEITANHSEKSDFPPMTVHNTEDMNFTCNISPVDVHRPGKGEGDLKMERKVGSNEMTVFVGDMEMTKTVSGGELEIVSALSNQMSDKKDVSHIEAGLSQSFKNVSSLEKVSKQNAISDGNSKRVEGKSGLDDQDRAESLHVSLLDKFLGSQEMDMYQSEIDDGAGSNESLHDSISLSEIAGMKSPKESSGQEKEKDAAVVIDPSDISSKDRSHQSMLECGNNSFVNANSQKSFNIDDNLHGVNASVLKENMEDGIDVDSQEMELAPQNDGDEESLHDSISLSEIAGLKSPKQSSQEVENSVDKNGSVYAENKVSKENTPGSKTEEINKSVDAGKRESPEKNVQLSEQTKKREALRKSLCSEMMFPNLAKSFSHLSKPNTVGVAKTGQSGCEVPSKHTPHKLGDGGCESGINKESDGNKTEGQLKLINMRLSSDFFENEGLLDEGDCPTLEDAFDNIPLNESVQEELVFSYMHSIIEAPGDVVDQKKESKQDAGECSKEIMEFSDICKVLGIDFNAEQGKELTPKPIPTSGVSDKLNACLVVKPEVATLETYLEQLQEGLSREQLKVRDNLEKFSSCPPPIFKDVRCATKQGQDVSSVKSRVRDMTKLCRGSTRSKHNRHKADYLVELTLAQQEGHSQHKKDLDTILSDIERVANVSAEIDKCMEDLNIISDTRSEIRQLQTKTVEFESETRQLRSRCDRMDKEIDELNKNSKNYLHKMKEDEDEELVLLDQISFMSCLSEWSLLKQSRTKWTFGFLSNTIILNVSLSDTKSLHQRISDISFRSRLSSKSTHWARISHRLMFSSLDREALMNRFQSFSQLNKLVAHVSELAGVSRDLCAELKDVHLKHHLKGDGLRVHIQLLSHDCQQTIEVMTTLHPGLYTEQSLNWEANVLLSPLSPASVVDALHHVTPGPKYISRSLDSVLSLMAR